MQRLKDTECFYNLIGQEPSNPRDIFCDYVEELERTHRQIKAVFKDIFKHNLHLFRLGTSLDEFKRQLKKFDELIKFCENTLSNSFQYYTEYLYKKLVKRQQKAVRKLIKFFYKNDVSTDATMKDLEVTMQANENASYFGSLDPSDKEKLLREYQQALSDENKLVAFVKSKLSARRQVRTNNEEESLEREPARNRRKRRERRSGSSSRNSNRRNASQDSQKSDVTEQGEIKNYDRELLRKRNRQYR